MEICQDFALIRAKGSCNLCMLCLSYLAFIWSESITFIQKIFLLPIPSSFKGQKPTNSRMGTSGRQWWPWFSVPKPGRFSFLKGSIKKRANNVRNKLKSKKGTEGTASRPPPPIHRVQLFWTKTHADGRDPICSIFPCGLGTFPGMT